MKKMKFSAQVSDMAKVFSGEAISFAVNLLTLPILTRLYPSSDFGAYQLLLSSIVVILGVSSLKLETAIVLPRTSSQSNLLFSLCLYVMIGVTLLVTIAFVSSEWVSSQLNINEVKYGVFIVPGLILISGVNLLLNYSAVFYKKFGLIARSVVTQKLTVQGVSILLGWVLSNYIGLVLGYGIGMAIGTLIYFFGLRKNIQLNYNKRQLKLALFRYKKFTYINTPSAFVGSFITELPVFMLSSYAGVEIVGFFMLARRVLSIPTNKVGQAVAKVYLKDISEAKHKGRAFQVYTKTLKLLLLSGFLPCLSIFFLGDWLVDLVFGEEWKLTADIIKICIFYYYFQFVSVPLSSTLSVIGKQEYSLYLKIIFLFVGFGGMYIFRHDWKEMLIALSITYTLFYVSFITMVGVITKRYN